MRAPPPLMLPLQLRKTLRSLVHGLPPFTIANRQNHRHDQLSYPAKVRTLHQLVEIFTLLLSWLSRQISHQVFSPSTWPSHTWESRACQLMSFTPPRLWINKSSWLERPSGLLNQPVSTTPIGGVSQCACVRVLCHRASLCIFSAFLQTFLPSFMHLASYSTFSVVPRGSHSATTSGMLLKTSRACRHSKSRWRLSRWPSRRTIVSVFNNSQLWFLELK